MRCVICNDQVAGSCSVILVQGKGPAHDDCFQQSLVNVSSRCFVGLDLTQINENILRGLLELVTKELSTRAANDDIVELFD